MGKSDTIVAQASPAGRGAVSLVRVSGSRVKELAEAVLGKLPSPRQACFSSFRAEKGEIVDQGIALFFPGPQSFTGEDVLELQGHGGPIVVQLLIQNLVNLGARLARPGEFSERAFLNGKIDLAQAEAIADLIQASTEQAARSALRSLQGEFSRKIEALVQALIQLRSYLEAAIDFAEEELNLLSEGALKQRFEKLLEEVVSIQNTARQGSLLAEGLRIVIAGQPNVGKSTLLNLLSGKELAIVSAIPGTTRDLLRESIQLDGLPLHLIDTAGLRESRDPIEAEGIRRAQQEIKQADLLLYLLEATDAAFLDSSPQKTLLNLLARDTGFHAQSTIFIRNKIDLLGEQSSLEEKDGITLVSLSAKTQNGLSLLKTAIKNRAGFSLQQEGIFSARQRHLDALDKALQFLSKAFQQFKTTQAVELIAEDLRLAQRQLSEICGEYSSDDLLGHIFSSFCIGK
ncbi:MAG TPA: tRNA uridine-5-carboxymethylaminomethyl(34) synthesis GTPase MnmE [Gammaproteobacteria bacterium]|nr:tRNA uridine-5-carboxymethylaminomethyl(34) synthesis GTPase MnmE [Gammaproteobacteria bacterium]